MRKINNILNLLFYICFIPLFVIVFIISIMVIIVACIIKLKELVTNKMEDFLKNENR